MENIKQKFQNLPIKKKLMTIILSVSSLCIFLTVLTLSINGTVNIKKQMSQELAITGTIIGNRINAALLFDNNSVALETLKALSANKSILLACVFDKKSKVFAKYTNGEVTDNKCPHAQPSMISFSNNSLQLYKEITDPFNNQQIGILFIKSDLSRISSYIYKQTYIGLIIILFTFILAFVLAAKLQNIISKPINYLLDKGSHDNKFFIPSKAYLESGDEIIKLEHLFKAIFSRIKSLETEAKNSNLELQNIVKNSESTLKYLADEMKQPLEATMAFNDIISCKSIGEINKEYIAYYNDVYLTVLYYYGVANDTMSFFKNHLKSESTKKYKYTLQKNIEDVIKKVPRLGNKDLQNIETTFSNKISEEHNNLNIDNIIITEIINNVIFIFTKYLTLKNKNQLTVTFKSKDLKLQNQNKMFQLVMSCKDLQDLDFSDILLDFKKYNHEIHLIRSKMQYLKYIASYSGGYLNVGNDLRIMSEISLILPWEKIYAQNLSGRESISDFRQSDLAEMLA
jgi:hypothetical protein